MMFTVWVSSLTLSNFILAVCCIAINSPGFELVEPPPGNQDVCLESYLTFSCTTTGRGTTELMFEAIPVPAFRFRHSLYTPGAPNQNDNEGHLDGEVRAGNLSRRSDSDDCFNSQHNTTDCYTTSLVVHITSRTMCGIITCSTIFNDGTGDIRSMFGNATVIARTPPKPTNLNVSTLSPENLTVTWEAGTSTDCAAITYEVTTTCGSCHPKLTTRDNYITCKDLISGQWCNVSVRSMLECEVYSNITTLQVLVPEASPTTKKNKNTLGISLGVSLSIVGFIIGAIVGILICIYCAKRSSKSFGVERVPEPTPTPDHRITTSDSKNNEEDTEISLNVTKVGSEDPVGSINMDWQQLLPPPNPDQSVTPEEKMETDEKQTSLVNGAAAVTGSSDQPLSTSSKEYEGRCDDQEVGGTNTDALPPPVQSTDESVIKEKPAALVAINSGVKTIGVSSQDEDTSAAAFRDIPVMAMWPPPVQAFSASAESELSGKQSTNSTVPSSLVMESDNMEAYTGPKPSKQGDRRSESGKPLSQDSDELILDGEEEVIPTCKQPVALSDNEEGPSQAVTVAINAKGVQKFPNVSESCPADVPVILKRVEERLANLETNQLEAQKERNESKTKIELLNAQILKLSDELETMRNNYAALERKSEAERQRHQQEEEELRKLIEQLKEELAAERAKVAAEKEKVQRLEQENKMPKKTLSTDANATNTLETRPGYLRTTSCPVDSYKANHA